MAGSLPTTTYSDVTPPDVLDQAGENPPASAGCYELRTCYFISFDLSIFSAR